jgi:DNA invertase Pin-like site-specific DNA recombinase
VRAIAGRIAYHAVPNNGVGNRGFPQRAIYARVSTKNGGQDPLNQVSQLREYCQKQGWEIAAEYIDQCSGKTSERPQFKAMFDAAYRREFDVVLFWSLDRFSREGVLETLTAPAEAHQLRRGLQIVHGRVSGWHRTVP